MRAPERPARLILDVLERWLDYHQQVYSGRERTGRLLPQLADVRTGRMPAHDFLFFSPPYANRLDYATLWRRELEVLEVMGRSQSMGPLLGTTQVKKAGTIRSLDDPRLATLPRATQAALRAIWGNPAKASSTYYFPFFANFAVELWNAAYRAGHSLRHGGSGVFFARDTARKTTTFPTIDLLCSALEAAGCSMGRRVEEPVRHHIGNLRPRRHGLSQTDVAQMFEKR